MASPTGKTEGGGGGPSGKSRAGRQQFSRKILNPEGDDGLGRQNQRLNMNIATPSILHLKSPFYQRFWAFKSSWRTVVVLFSPH
ncbi:hypothetical protein CXP52_08905 [Bacillus paralicheniformis]|nr:hypothetical protein CXP52_08905 [Bacillus paralicheniformis]